MAARSCDCRTPTAWSHSALTRVLADSDMCALAFEQETVDVLAMRTAPRRPQG
jgi:hypothetical protein